MQINSAPGLVSDISFIALAILVFMVIFTLGRCILLFWNRACARDVSKLAIVKSFANGVRFDLQIACAIVIPMVFALLLPAGLSARWFWIGYLLLFGFVSSLLVLIEAEFYREFQARLNSIVIQYLSEDFKTVISMVVIGGPVVAFTTAIVVITSCLILAVTTISQLTQPDFSAASDSILLNYSWRLPLTFMVFLLIMAGARGTLRQGAPLRWGDAFNTGYLFTNHLGLNGIMTLFKAWQGWGKDKAAREWIKFMDREQALKLTRDLLLQPCDELIAPLQSPLLRKTTPQGPVLEGVNNIVFILMESFTSRFVGAQGAPGNITPFFDKLAAEGCLCRQMFSVGTHTHQGMFGTFSSFPNLPDYEYLMQQPAGSGMFSGLPAIMTDMGYDSNVFVYNGDFAWDNQQGFFGAQGMTRFIGRDDYVDPVFSDLTWGVCDEDMFNRSLEELDLLHTKGKPFYGLLQTLSNHLPYALPKHLPIENVTAFGDLNKHLTAMRYSDWALGKFFSKAKEKPWYDNTLFVVLADHGFGVPGQVSSINLQRFHIPALFLAPGIQQKIGPYFDKTCSQLDMANTAVSLLGKPFVQAGWGRNIFNLADDDPGYAIMKPSGSDKTVAMVSANQVIVKGESASPEYYQIDLGFPPGDTLLNSNACDDTRYQQLGALLQTAVLCLKERKTGHQSDPHNCL
jgi:phosphoglycerol transferase MdoB-like AlkP superfamily enzyme